MKVKSVLTGGRCSILFVFVALFIGQSLYAGEPWKSIYYKVKPGDTDWTEIGETYRVNVSDLRPTQFAVGMAEVKNRAERISNFDEDDLRKYLKKKVGRIVIGPGETLWVVDGHHLARALLLEDEEEMLVRVTAD